MSKASELRVLKYGRSADAPIQHHHRTGDTEGANGTMLDIYAQAESAEDLCLQEEDEQAKAVFLRGFSGYMQKVFSPKERKFLSRLMSGKEKPREVGKALGVDWFHFMQTLQHKAYKNTAPLLRLVELSGWTRAEEFTSVVLRRLSLLNAGAELDELLPDTVNRTKARAEIRESKTESLSESKLLACEKSRRYRERHPEKVREAYKKYREINREIINERKKEYRRRDSEKIAQYNKEKRARDKKKMQDNPLFAEKRRLQAQARKKAWKEREKAKRLSDPAYNKTVLQKHREQVAKAREKEKLRKSVDKNYEQERREKDNARSDAWRKANPEKRRQQIERYRARKKAERQAERLAKEAVALDIMADALENRE